jgi:LacI family transcriptional regulator
LILRGFDALAPDFNAQVVDPLRKWKPDGIIARLAHRDRLKQLIRVFPGVPIVSSMPFVEETATCVGADCSEHIALARDHFIQCGVPHMALFIFGSGAAVYKVIFTKFRELVPDGFEWHYPLTRANARTPSEEEKLEGIIGQALRKLPKPLGVLTLEAEMAAVILRACRAAGLRVPEEVQIIGLDGADECLAQTPSLTALEIPSVQIGQTALDTLVRCMRRESPSPPHIVRVKGGAIVARHSTQLISIGRTEIPVSLELMKSYALKGLTAEEAAKRAKVGRTSFYRDFHATTGETPGQHLRKLRLEEACRLLCETSESVTAIAERCGFSSLSVFLHFFRRKMKETPSAYRHRMAPRVARSKKGVGHDTTGNIKRLG